MVKLCNTSYNKKNDIFSMWDFELSDFQKYAIESIIQGNNTIITAHTGSGKTLPAEFLLRHCKDKGKKTIYTTPIKALSNEKFHDLQNKYPEISFGIITGDIKFNPEADVLIMTTECLCNTLYQMKMLKEETMKPEQLNLLFEIDVEKELGGVVFDEIHYINDPDRGHVWEETIMMLPNQVQILGLSATMNKPENFCKWIENIKNKEVWLCPNKQRVVPLKHYSFMSVAKSTYEKFPPKIKSLFEDNDFYEKGIMLKEKKFNDITYEKISKIVKFFKINNVWVDKKFVLNRMTHYLKINNLLPAIYFVFSQKKTEIYAKCISINLFEEGSKVPSIIKDECKKIMMKIPNYREYIELPEYKKIVSLLEKGIAYHHAGVTNVFREMIEMLFSKGYIKLLFATETFSVGINMPTRTVVFTSMKKYSNNGFRFLKSHEYTQMSGRAGRRGIDTVGHVFHLTNFYAIQENNYPSTQTMREIFSGKPPSIESKFKINPNIILKLLCVGKNNFEEFISSSMVSELFKNQSKLLNEIISNLVEKSETIKFNLENLRTSLEDLEKYHQLEQSVKNASRKKRSKMMREMTIIKEQQKSFNDDYDCYLRSKSIQMEIEKNKCELTNLETYVQNEVQMILQMLINNNFVVAKRIENTEMITMYNSIEKHQIVYTLTEKGQMASNINELHPLAMGNILDSKILNTLSPSEIASVLSIFTNMKLSDDDSVLDKHSLYISKNAINVIDKIEEEHKWFYDIQLRQKMEDIQSEYLDNIQYNMCDFIKNWWDASDANQCYKLVQEMKTYNVSLGKIIKSILKTKQYS